MINTQSLEEQGAWNNWRGLGGWNYYFLLKFALLWYGYLNFHPFANLIFLAFLLFPLSSDRLHRYRQWLAIPIGLALFYHDTWLPNIYSIFSQGASVLQFDRDYLLELLQRFINWQMIGAALVLLVAYLFISQWLRITLFTVLALCWLNVGLLLPDQSLIPANSVTGPTGTAQSKDAAVGSAAPPTNTNLNAYLSAFYDGEKKRHTTFPAGLTADAVPFDILLIQVCSLAWADIDAVKLQNHPIWNRFDILFNKFNSAASYSGPAAVRLLRASCGQEPHSGLYTPAANNCYLMDNLNRLGFTAGLMLDSKGLFGDFLQTLRTGGNLLQTPLMPTTGITKVMIEFNGEPLFSDPELLKRWMDQRKAAGDTSRSATYFNIVKLHDGNHSLDNKQIPYRVRASTLFDDLDNFFTTLEKSGRRTMVVMIPEHGANLVGDKLQMAGLRDIPSPAITNIPVGIKFTGLKTPNTKPPLQVSVPTSYLALSELISRLMDGRIFKDAELNLPTLVSGLPETAVVSSNEGVTVIDYQGNPFVLLKGDSSWVPYPK